jgi:hypothetical protein
MSLSGSGKVTIPGNLVVLGGISGSSAESSSYALNADKIDNLDSTQLVLTSSFNSYTSSASSSLGSLSGSVATTTLNLSSSVSSSIGSLSGSIATTTSELSSSIGSLSSSVATTTSGLSSSVATTTSGLAGRIGTIEGNYATTGSNTFVGSQVITGSLYITNDMVVQGCSCLQNITASAVSIGTNTVMLNTATPAVRFAGISVQDSGSNAGVTGSIYWDGLCNRWIYSNPSNVGYSGGMILSGPRNLTTIGNESTLTCNYLAKSGGGDHLYDSCIQEVSGSVTIGGTLCSSGVMCAPSLFTTCFRIDSNGDMYQSTIGATALWGAIGNVTYPTYGFYGNTGIGMYRSAADTLSFAVNGAERFRLLSGGNTYFSCNAFIGSPTDNNKGAKLQITQAASNTNAIDFKNTDVTYGRIGTFANGLYLTQNYYYAGGQNNDCSNFGQVSVVLAAGTTNTSTISFALSDAGTTSPSTKMIMNSSGVTCFANTICACGLDLSNTGRTTLRIFSGPADNEPGVEWWSSYPSAAERNWRIGTSDKEMGDFVIKSTTTCGTAPDSSGCIRIHINNSGVVCFSCQVCTTGLYSTAAIGINSYNSTIPLQIKRWAGSSGTALLIGNDNVVGMPALSFCNDNGGGTAYVSMTSNCQININGSIYACPSGYVGIGTSSPTVDLSVKPGVDNAAIRVGTWAIMENVTTNQTMFGYNTAYATGLGTGWRYINNGYAMGIRMHDAYGSGDIMFHLTACGTGGTNLGGTWDGTDLRMIIKNDGKVGIGTITPVGRLEIMNCSASTWSIIARHAVSSGVLYGILSTIQNQAPNNTSNYLFYGDDNQQARMIVYSNGTVSNATGTYNTIASDIRLKQDITNASSQWCDIKNLRLVNFRFKKDVEYEGDSALRHLGLIAQEVEETSPNLVENVTDRCGNTNKTIKTSIIHLKAVKALQEAMCRIEIQEDIINILKSCAGIS